MHLGFNDRRAVQVVAFFSEKEGGSVPVLKLIKLVYLADRQSMSETGYPITNDYFVSMPEGPVNSLTLNFVNGNIQSDDWNDLMADRDNYSVGLVRELTESDRDQLSDMDLEVLNCIWDRFGHMDKWQIRDWTHDNCPEWEDPQGSSNPIPHERVLKFLKVDGAPELAQEIESDRSVEMLFSELRG